MELSKERLEKIADLARKANYKRCAMHMTNLIATCDSEVIEEMASRLLAAEEQRPYGYFTKFAAEDYDLLARCSKETNDAFPLYLHPQQGKTVQVPDENGLLPCPFCGGVASVVDNRLGFYVKCNDGECDATAIGLRVRELNSEQEANAIDWNALEQSAKDKWNRRAAMLEPVSNRDELLFIAEKLVNRYLLNKDSENESIACVAASKNTIRTGGVWDDWKALDAALKAYRWASNTD